MKRQLSFFVLLMLCVTIARSQTRIVSGRVISDSTKKPLSGVTVTIKGSKAGTSTDSEGQYSIALPDKENTILVFSSIGYVSHEAAVGQKTTVNVSLSTAFGDMSEIVIIGYQPVRKKDLLASSSAVTSKDLKDNPLNNAAEVLQGRLAGVQVTLSEGAPGADAVINIRGRGSITQSGDPLYVVDGIPMDNALTVLNPQDIESLNVLKDAASTAIYGSRGANGVVVITTKGGKNTNGKTNVSYNMYYGFQQLAQKIPMMNAYDYVSYQYDRAWWLGDTAGVIKKYIRFPTNFDTLASYKDNPGFDWQERTMGRNAPQWSHNITISGGNANTTYNLSLTANKQDGILINSDLDRKIAAFRLDHKANDRFKFGVNTRYTHQLINGAGTSDARGGGANRLKQYTRYKPLLMPGEEEDSYDPDLDLNNAGNGFNILNPILLAQAETRRRYYTQLILNAYIQFNILRNLSLRSTAAYTVNSTRNRSFDDTLTNNAKTYNKQPVIVFDNSQSILITNSNVLTYTNSSLFGSKHSLSVLAGQEIQKTTNNADRTELRYFPIGITADEAFNNLQLAAASTQANPQPLPSSSQVPVSLASFFSTIDYNYAQKYYAKFTVRADGSSIFNQQNRWGYFPSGVFSWRVSRENFFPHGTLVNDLRLRFSYGTSGNNRITPFSYRTQYSSPANGGYGLNGALYGVYNPSNLGNEELRWESQVAQNLGLDISLWNERVTVTIDAYSNRSDKLLLNQTIPSSTGYITQFQNIGSTTNRGMEAQIAATMVRSKNFSWSGNFNIAFNKNRITSLGGNDQILRNSGWFSTSNFPADYVLKVGEEIGAMYGYINDGFYTLDDFTSAPYSNTAYPQYNTIYTLNPKVASAAGILANPLQPGSPKFKDLNDDGKIDADNDRTIIGHAQPKFFGGLSQTFTYKAFDLSVFCNFVYGNDVFNANKLEYSSAYGSEVNLLNIDNGRWRMTDENGKPVQRTITTGGVTSILGADPATLGEVNKNATIWFPSTSINGFYSQRFAIENGSYLRINNVTLGYNLPKSLLSKVKISTFRLYATVNNLATLTGYTGYDPDASTRRADPTTPGVDYAAYPRARTFVAGLNITF
ncbi:SusC/RagA family TonB-linked outer membrane protein [Niastella sp. OAS944]|uniref:SusC/RagA family TonB-linked outer membrane protein n=1 Tax=Niastella sp. OAS944 TaxID=2664089 RepID=UPI003481B0A0|nr:TonB-linked SusC/RagA family outer membrane protein [Chitinophagaceae bacterium OAS944]